MTLVTWNPWQEIDTFNHQLNQLFDDVLTTQKRQKMNQITTVPAAEISESEDAIYLKLELPGIDADTLDINATEKSISVSGERQVNTTTGATRSEFRYGKFQRVVALPARIQNTAVKADYKDGILSLTLPKTVAEQNKVVKVQLDSVSA